MPPTDYDLTELPAGYDRARDHGPEVLALWMDVVASLVGTDTVHTILDLGCGTGRFSQGLAIHFNARVVGIDPSAKMLEQAHAKRRGAGVNYGRGTAEALPVATGIVDVIFISMSFHHFRDSAHAAEECRRVLRKGGTVIVRTGTREQIPLYPYVPFLPQMDAILKDVLPSGADLVDVFARAGFRTHTHRIVTQPIAPTWTAYADKLAAGSDSALARLPPGELTKGIEAVRRHDAAAQGPVVEPIDVFCFR